MAESSDPNDKPQLPEIFNPFKEITQLPDGIEQSFKAQTYDPDIKSAQIEVSLMQTRHQLEQDAADKESARRQSMIEAGWSKFREVVFFVVLAFSIFQCWNIAANSKSVDAQKAAIAAGSSLVTGTVMYFLGKQASKS